MNSLLFKTNVYVLKQLFSPPVLHATPESAELNQTAADTGDNLALRAIAE